MEDILHIDRPSLFLPKHHLESPARRGAPIQYNLATTIAPDAPLPFSSCPTQTAFSSSPSYISSAWLRPTRGYLGSLVSADATWVCARCRHLRRTRNVRGLVDDLQHWTSTGDAVGSTSTPCDFDARVSGRWVFVLGFDE
ncbi:hypothetical protein HMN09_00260300 [Mycena chlorophos]|uniref:Uncharacterized protein n=1 Tax=Mycena chlorophos TaxID=658473 RepID=A0A8H6WHV2_MYCCL|nr:hypothetical protein HMN09_00260300 [Mycena chlorophos]